jgi:hypothetical protein
VSSSSPALIAALAAALALGACQPVPQPFSADDSARKNGLLRLSDRSGIVVLDIDGASAPASRALADQMARALLDRNVPAATAGGNRASNFLHGSATVREVDARRVEVTVVWELMDPKGRLVGIHSATQETDAGAWRQGARDAVGPIVAASAASVAALVQEPAPRERRDPIEGRAVRVAAIEGAPAPAAQSMRRHLADALRRAGFAVGDDGADALSIAGRVHVTPEAKGSKRLDLVWIVRRADGVEIGNLKQGNVVEDADLAGEWNDLAWAATTAAVEGIVDLVRSLDEDALQPAAPEPARP